MTILDTEVPTIPAQALVREVVAYGLASAMALGADATLLFSLTHYLGLHYLPASAMSFVAGAVVAYLLSVRWAFHTHRLRNRSLEFGWFTGLGLVGLAVNSAAMFIAVGKIGLPVLSAKAIAAAFTFSTNFVLRRQLLFRPAATHGSAR